LKTYYGKDTIGKGKHRMAAFQSQEEMSVGEFYNEHVVRGLDKDQDYAYSGRVEKEDKEESYSWFIGLDGHGNEGCEFFNIIKNMEWSKIAEEADSSSAVLAHLSTYKGKYIGNAGATYYEAKMFHNRVETCTIGDSQVAVFIDKKLAYISTPHNLKNPLEVQRLKSRFVSGDVYAIPSSQVAEVFGANKVRFRSSEYIYFENSTKTAMTQTLGHDGITGYAPEKHTIFFKPDQEVCVVGGSDGFWDMVNMVGPDMEEDLLCIASKTATELADMAEGRWKQEWNLHWKDATGKERVHVTGFENKERTPQNPSTGFDDVSVCKISNRKME